MQSLSFLSAGKNTAISPGFVKGRPVFSGVAVGLLSATLSMVAITGCAREPSVTVPVEGALSFEDSVLYGFSGCSADTECPAGICAGGTCVGFLMVPSDMARNMAGDRVAKALAGHPDLADRLAGAAASVAADTSAEVYSRARAADLFRFIPCGLASSALGGLVTSTDEPVRFYAARSLALCGDPAGRAALAPFLQHDSEPIRVMAENALSADVSETSK